MKYISSDTGLEEKLLNPPNDSKKKKKVGPLPPQQKKSKAMRTKETVPLTTKMSSEDI